MNEEAKELTVEFLMNQLAIEDCNAQHKILSQLNSSSSMTFAAYNHRQNKGKSNKPKCTSGKNVGQNNSGVQTSSNHTLPSRKPPRMEGKCMRCGKPEHQPRQKCAAKNAKCKECHKIGHFYKVCQSKKRGKRAHLAQIATPQTKQDTHIDENGVRQPNPPMVNMLKIVNHIGATRGSQEKHLKFPINVDPRGPYKHHQVVRVDTGADVNCMNEKTFKKLFPKVKLSVCPHEIQNFGNSVTDISILGQFCTYLQFRGEKYLNTFIVTNANDCPNLLSHGATFRMDVLLPNYLEENVVKGDQHIYSAANTLTQNMAQLATSFRTTTPSTAMTERMTTKQVNPVHQETPCKALLEHCMHVHQPMSQVCKPGESLALRKVKHPLNGRTSVSRLPLTKQGILSQYSSCFEGIGCFPGDPYKFHLKTEHKPAQHTPRKVPIHLEAAFKEEIESLVKQGVLEEVKEHPDWVNSYVIVEKHIGNHHSPNHTVKKKLRICLDPRDLNEALERKPYHTHSAEEITAKFLSRDRMEHIGHFPTLMEMCMDNHLTLTTEKTQQKQSQGKASEQCCSTHSISPGSQKNTVLSHAEFPPGMESMQFFLGNQLLQGREKSTLGTKLKSFMDTYTFTLDTDQKPSTSSKDTHKKGRMTATIAMIGITLRTVSMITTHILTLSILIAYRPYIPCGFYAFATISYNKT